MRVIDHSFTDPYFNLAAEEYLFRHLPETETACMLWQNRPAVIIGKYQDVDKEVNRAFAEANRIAVARRFSGGGAVYHDLGNLNLTFIGQFPHHNPEHFTRWLAGFLGGLGVSVSVDARQALFVEGLKISGSAQYIRRNRFLHHATLLFSTDLDRLRIVLDAPPNPPGLCTNNRRRLFTPSVKSPVANLSDFLAPGYSLETFRRHLLLALPEGAGKRENRPSRIACKGFDGQEIEAIKRLRNEKYANAAWNLDTYTL